MPSTNREWSRREPSASSTLRACSLQRPLRSDDGYMTGLIVRDADEAPETHVAVVAHHLNANPRVLGRNDSGQIDLRERGMHRKQRGRKRGSVRIALEPHG